MKYFFTSIFVLFVAFLNAQEFQRLFNADDGVNLTVIDALQTDIGDTYVLSKFLTEDTEDEGLVITKHNLKGDEDWTREIHLEEGQEITRYGDMQSMSSDSFLITFQVREGDEFRQGLIRTDAMGNVNWSFNYFTNSDSTNTARPVELALRDTSTFIMAGTIVDSIEYTRLWQIDGEGSGPMHELCMTDSTIINIFEQGDFGSGEDLFLQEDPGIAPGYTYTAGPPNDGFYTISNNLSNWSDSFDCWLPVQDNSNDPNGYMMVVNATVDPGIFYEEFVDNLSENTKYEFTADILNLISTDCDLIDSNVAFLIDGVAQFETGPIVESNEWKTYGFSFTTAPGQTSVQLSLRNNSPGGQGNDLALDNITFRPSLEKYSYSLSEISYDDKDSTIYLSGKILADSTQLFVAKLDTSYQQVWARSYHLPDMMDGQIYEQLITRDSGLVVVGTLRPDFTRGFVSKLNKQGEVQWFSTLNFANFTSGGTYMTGATIGQADEIVISGSYLENFAFSKPFMIAFNQDGTRLWEKQYQRESIVQLDLTSGIVENQAYLTIIDQGNLSTSPDGGYMLVNTAQEFSGGSIQSRINLNKTDNEGNSFILNEEEPSTCDADINLVVAQPIVLVDTLLISAVAEDYIREDLIAVDTSLFVSFSAPRIPLDADIQCPDDINVTLDAAVQDAVWYEWSTGDTTETITVMDTEQYSVTVAFDTETCFALCDTIEVPVYGPVEGQIALLNTQLWCELPRSFGLEVFPEGGAGDYTYAWAGGEDTPDVIRNQINTTYSVTVTDGCNQDTVLQTLVLESDLPGPDQPVISIDCANMEFFLTVSIPGGNIDPSTIVWSNGVVGQETITVTEITTYTATLNDDCQYEVSGQIDLAQVQLANEELRVIKDTDPCATPQVFTISALLDSGNPVESIMWDTGDSGSTITVSELGTYSVTVVDQCGFEHIGSSTISEEDFFMDVTLEIEKTCSESGSTATALSTGTINEDFGYIWSDGQLGQTVNLFQEGELTVTVQDVCGVPVTASTTINQGDFFPCECVSWPNFMNLNSGETSGMGTDERDPGFGPVNWCGDIVTDYVMNIHNAFGNLLYSTSNFDMPWNGQDQDTRDLMPSGVYKYSSVYSVNGEVLEMKGEFTLIR